MDAVKYDDTFPLWLTQRESFRSALATGLDVPIKHLVTPFVGARPDTVEGFSPTPSGYETQPTDSGPPGLPKTSAQANAVGLPPSMLPLVAALAAAESARGPREALIISRFMESEPFFADMDQKTILSIAKQASLAFYKRGEAIIRQGDAGDFLYVMFSGRAIVVVEGVGEITTLAAPCTFGELAMSHNAKRQASVISTTHVFSLAIGRVEYHDLVRSFAETRKVRLTKWFATIPFFTNWSHTRLNKLIARTVVKNLRVGEVVTVEGKKIDDIAFVKRGSLAISRIERTDTESRWPETVESTEAAIAAQIAIEESLAVEAKRSLELGQLDGSSSPMSPNLSPKVENVAAAATASATQLASARSAAGDALTSEFNPLPPELRNTYSGKVITARSGSSALRHVHSMGRLASLAAASTGVDLLPIPFASSPLKRTLVTSPPTARDRGWGAGSPGGSLAFSPRETNASNEHTTAQLKMPTVTYVDTTRRLPVGVAFHSVEIDVVVGVAREGALLGFTEALRNIPSPFTITASEPRTQIVLIPGRYLVLAPEAKRQHFQAPVKDKGSAVASEESFARLDAMCEVGTENVAINLIPIEAHQPRGLANILKECVQRLAGLGVMLKRENGMAQRVALATLADTVIRQSGNPNPNPGSRTRAACERSITELDRTSSFEPYLPASVSFVHKTLYTVFQRLQDKVELAHSQNDAPSLVELASPVDTAGGGGLDDDDGSSSYLSGDDNSDNDASPTTQY